MRACSNGLELEYETIGDRGGEPLLLITGLGAQLLRWPDPFCRQLAERGYYVIRFDNRDAGLSTRFDAAGVPDFGAVLEAYAAERPIAVPYSLHDMAADAIGLLDALGLERAHVCGASMGGMIAQLCAIEYPARVRTLTSLMSHTGRRGVLPVPSAEMFGALFAPPPPDRAAAVAQTVRLDRMLLGPVQPFDEACSRRLAERIHARGVAFHGTLRQYAAVLAANSRHEALARLELPALVMHGDVDPLIDVEGGRDTARHLRNARYVELPGVGHRFPLWAWSEVVTELARLTA